MMQRVKLFKGVEQELDALERDVNAWIESNHVKVISIFGNIAPQTMASSGSIGTVSFRGSDVLIIVHYEIQAL